MRTKETSPLSLREIWFSWERVLFNDSLAPTKSGVVTKTIEKRIYLVRGKRVMLDRDLSELYGVLTKVLNQSVKRNLERFPDDFMFQLTKEETQNWRSQIVTSKNNSRSQSVTLKPKPSRK